MSRRAAWLVLLAPAGLLPAVAAEGAASSCVACHGSPEWFDEESVQMVRRFGEDVHHRAGLSCHDCHGGNPDPALAEDLDAAMDPAFEANPYRGAPERTGIPAFCGRCHSDPTYMRRFRPDIRVDQEREYRTSRHGQSLERGDTGVATCVDCHGTHRILPVGDPGAPVYPTRVAETCRSCHGDPAHMAGYTLPDGRPLPVDQYARWKQSVHAAALLEREDLSAPTCNDCHGNHGATPPGLDSIAFVCGQCHGREAQLFRASAKQRGFAEHNAYLEGTEGCAACHEAPEPQAELAGIHSFSECASCHGNHGVVRPTLAMLSPLPETPCAFCHESPSPLASEVPEPEAKARNYRQTRDALLELAAARGLAGEERFDWLVDQARQLPNHTAGGGTGGEAELRPEFRRLFTKFRIGKTHYTYEDPATGEEARAEVMRCSGCHAAEPLLASEAAGLETSRAFLDGMREVIALTARAERILLAARRGGVETRQALAEIDGAVDTQIELEVLLHTFRAGEGSAFAGKQGEGLAHARAALAAGQSALDELDFRRQGLAVSLIFVLLVLVGLALKIRQLGHPEETPGG